VLTPGCSHQNSVISRILPPDPVTALLQLYAENKLWDGSPTKVEQGGDNIVFNSVNLMKIGEISCSVEVQPSCRRRIFHGGHGISRKNNDSCKRQAFLHKIFHAVSCYILATKLQIRIAYLHPIVVTIT
jgi:hypothetical protein